MSENQSYTPDQVAIQPRNRQHDLADALTRDWMRNDVFATAWFNAMSITFPLGEQFFINSVRHYRDRITDPKLKEEMQQFFSQEAVHLREHKRYNQLLCEQRGYDLETLEGPLRRRMGWVKKNVPAREQLAGTAAVEHLTAVLAEKALGDHGLFTDADPAMVALWQWHAVEEMEHKAVAFDVYRAIGGSEKMRRAAMRRSTLLLTWDILHGVRHMLKCDGKLWSPKVWLSGLHFLFGKQGLLRGTWGPYKAFFREDFHPWQEDSSELIAQWQLQQQ
ncbi:metal-dependent hydrolase [Porticoccaceae bacterium]|nr:metal-dependent hydrolase [Porticoccaceae bacterium]